MLSDSPPERDVQWTESGIEGAGRFTQRVWRLVHEAINIIEQPTQIVQGSDNDVTALLKEVHRVTDAIGAEIEALRFNRAVAHLYELTNALARFVPLAADNPSTERHSALRIAVEHLIIMMAPMMPHLAESCWAALGRDTLVCDTAWPEADPAYLGEETITLPVQVNGKRRGEITVSAGAPQSQVEAEALSLEAVARMLDGRPPRRLIVVPGRIVNVVL
jgi:leucyl-tRNA synthetase